MSNGIRCCILGPCCPPPPPVAGGPRVAPEAVAALAKELEPVTGNSKGVAAFLFEHYDLVPAGVGTAILNAYAPEFAKKYAHQEGG
jgi:hypothetical protein